MSLYHVYAPHAGVSRLVETDSPEDAESQVRDAVVFEGAANVSHVASAEGCCDKEAKLLPKKNLVVEVVTQAPQVPAPATVIEEVPEAQEVAAESESVADTAEAESKDSGSGDDEAADEAASSGEPGTGEVTGEVDDPEHEAEATSREKPRKKRNS